MRGTKKAKQYDKPRTLMRLARLQLGQSVLRSAPGTQQ